MKFLIHLYIVFIKILKHIFRIILFIIYQNLKNFKQILEKKYNFFK